MNDTRLFGNPRNPRNPTQCVHTDRHARLDPRVWLALGEIVLGAVIVWAVIVIMAAGGAAQ
jgi:hypothetical protein